MMKSSKQQKNKARAAAFCYAVIVFLLLFFLGFRAPFPPPEEEGIMVNLGFTDQGLGEVDPQEVEEIAQTESTVEEVSSSEEVIEEVVEQSVDESVSITQKEEPKPKNTPEETKPTEEQTEPVKEEPKVNENALFTGASERPAESEGITEGQGNQGQEDGELGAPNYEGQNSGLGNQGIGYDLTGRSMVGVPRIIDNSQREGTVVIKIKVDRNGQVLSAVYTPVGSTTTDSYLVSKAIEAAKKARFNSDNRAAEEQFGTMTFRFTLR